jgi:NhaP-type Na+/H+ or K+/H+ antiporter
MAIATILIQVEHTFISFSPFIAIVSMGFVVLEKQAAMADVLSDKLSHIWTFASVLLFVTVGAQVNVHLAWSAGWPALLLIVSGLLVRSAAVLLTLVNSVLSMRERYFVVVSFWPKATVQAAMGAVPLFMMAELGMNTLPGEWILAVSVLSILITAPLGAIAVAFSADRCLK